MSPAEKELLIIQAIQAIAAAESNYLTACQHADLLMPGEANNVIDAAVTRAKNAEGNLLAARGVLMRIYDGRYDNAPAPTHAPQSPPATPTSDTGKEGTICPKCGSDKRPGYENCYDCAAGDYDKCPVPGCEKNKKKQYPICYTCKEAGRNEDGNPSRNVGYPRNTGTSDPTGRPNHFNANTDPTDPYDNDPAPF